MDKTEQKVKLEECVSYFKERPVYKKLFLKMREKYEGLGRFGGTVCLTGLDREEKNQLGGFFQKDYTSNKTISISAKKMEQCLMDSKFSEFTWEIILEAYFKESLIGRKEIERRRSEKRESYFAELLVYFSGHEGRAWLESVLTEQKEGYLLLMQLYKENQENLTDILNHVMQGILELKMLQDKKKKEFLAVFSAKATGNPHYFDEGKQGEKLLFAYIRSQVSDVKSESLSRVEYKNKLYYEAGILKDEVSNDVLAYGIHGWKADGELHEGIEGFLKNKEPVKLTLQTIGNLQKICGQEKRVYVVENPAVFSVLVGEHPEWTIVCGNGQLRLAVLILMDKFTKDSVFWYAGDFDPEGLLIAQRLKVRFQDRLILWNYHVSWYEKYLSEVELTEKRVKKLEQVYIGELQEMREAMYRKRKAAYQETMIGLLLY